MTDGIYLLLGSNLGDKKTNLAQGKKLLEEFTGQIINASLIYETAAWGKTDQQVFYNQVVEIETHLLPRELLLEINRIEHQLGRTRREKWGRRIIDIDILYYQDLILNEPDLIIPHPGIPDRRFTLIPLVEIAAEFIHPIHKMKQSKLLSVCNDDLSVTPTTELD